MSTAPRIPPPPPLAALRALRISPVPLLAALAGSSATPLSFAQCAQRLEGEGGGWEGKVLLVTGAASGIGRAVARRAAKLGAKLVLGDLQSQELQLRELVEQIKRDGGAGGREATYAVCDVTSWEDQVALFKHAQSSYGHIDVVFANAGITTDAPILDSTSEEVQKPDTRALDINLTGVVYTATLAHHYLAKLNPRKEGKTLLITGSLASFLGMSTPAMYAASKHGVLGLARALAPILGKSGIAGATTLPLELVDWRGFRAHQKQKAKGGKGVGEEMKAKL
ncbi:hypothetical protein JCM8097_000058 [Rhodosporidiobolus ruineniae]